MPNNQTRNNRRNNRRNTRSNQNRNRQNKIQEYNEQVRAFRLGVIMLKKNYTLEISRRIVRHHQPNWEREFQEEYKFYIGIVREVRDDAKDMYNRMSEELKKDPNVIQDHEVFEKTVQKLQDYENHWLQL